MLRLLWLIDSLHVGGAEALALPFSAHTHHDLTVACLKTTGGNLVEHELRRRGVKTLNLHARNLRDREAFARLAAFVREERIQLVHAHLTYSAIWSALLTRKTGVPSIVSLHVAPTATREQESSAVRKAGIHAKDHLMRFAVNRWSNAIVTVSAGLRDFYGDGLDARKVRVVHNGIDVARFRRDRAATRARLDREYGVPSGAKLAVTVSVLRPGKGIEVLLDAIPRVPDTVFLIVGDGPKREEWQAASRTDRVRWAGYRTDVNEILAGCDVFVHPSLDDAFPTVLLEAMAAGLPVVASRVGGIPEIVVDGVTGTLVPPGDAQALADAIRDESLPSMSAAALARAETEFSIAAWIDRLERVYREVVPS